MRSRIIFAFILTLTSVLATEAIRFIPATTENTRLADGSPLPDNLGSIGWNWLPEMGNGGIVESLPTDKSVASPLMVMASGLVIEKLYHSGHHDRIGFRELEVPEFNYVWDALEAQQWEMMAFLLQKGCPASKGKTNDFMRLAVVQYPRHQSEK